VSLVFTKHEVS